MTAYGYVRSATGKVEAIEEQRRTVQAIFACLAAKPGPVYADSGSGLTKPEERPGLSDLLSLLGDGDILVVTDHDRISRNPSDLAAVLSALKERNVTVITLDDMLKRVSDDDLAAEMRRRRLI